MLLRTTTPQRGGFTLLEVLIVIVIMVLLISLTLGAVFKGMVMVRRANTERTMQKVHERIAKRAQQISEEVRNIEPNGNLLELAGRDRQRARVLLQKFIAKWSFPMSFDEIEQNLLQSRVFYDGEGHPSANFFHSRLNGLTGGNLDQTNAACLGLIAERLGASDDLSGSERSTVTFGGQTFPVILDGWGLPMRYYRCPLNYPQANGVNRLERLFPADKWGVDADDPQGLLNLTRAENYDTNGSTSDWFNLAFNDPISGSPTTCGQWVHANLQQFPTPVPRAPVYCPMTIVSMGPDQGGSGAQRIWGYLPNDYYMQVDPAAQGREADNLYSCRARIGLSGQ
jgi:prepilin-type N-terminal cleavage/methylation domain-containing protein